MDRRTFLKIGAKAAIGATVIASTDIGKSVARAASEATASAPARRPNIIHIIPHDLGRNLNCYGESSVQTPNLDHFASQGVIMTNYFCASTACSPSRGCTMTGRYAHSNGLVGLVNRGWSLPEKEKTIVDYLNDAGYETYHVGLQHERSDRKLNRHKHYGTANIHCGDVNADACKMLGAIDPKAGPFYMNIGYFETHAPYDRPEYQGRCTPEQVKVPPFLRDTPSMRKQLSEFNGSVSYMDESIAQVFKTLHETGLEDNTIVLFTTDHGIGYPRAKGTLYDPGLTISLLMRWPEHIEPGSKCSHMLTNIDLVPTLLDLAGLPIPSAIQGRSFAPALLGKSYRPNEEVFFERNYHDDYDPMRAVRTSSHKLIRNYAKRSRFPLPNETKQGDRWKELSESKVERPFEELYDLRKDPNEFVNVAGDPEYKTVLVDLRKRMEKWMMDTDDPMRGAQTIVHGPVSRIDPDLVKPRAKPKT